ncbi:OmpA family protein [Hyphomicrobium sp.]|uniref:OmpA family protein n=1 Tax=Hyphomicrobium sp. TaxID=82 RepID=UPI0025C4FAC4|nr:OmpA family protein [Hyphomicrobium sp.]MCC7252132.1 OmpA family protein [Hyphomicrobium sp.]
MPDRQAELEKLKRILLAEERTTIETLRRALAALDERVGDDDRFRDSMTRELVAAFRAAEAHQHRDLAEALSPLVLAGIRREIVQSRDLMVEALYPITGRLVSTAVARAFQRLVADINAKLEAAVSPLNWRRRLKSLVTGRPLAEIILSEAIGFQLERLLLIDRTTGALLATWPARKGEERQDGQTALMGGLLSAIVSFSRDAFEGEGHDLRALDLGDRVVMLRSSARRIVAAVGRGAVDEQVEARADSAFLSMLEQSATADDEVDSHALLGSLASALAAQAVPARQGGAPVPLLIVVTLLLAGLGYWGVRALEARRAEQRLDASVAALGERVAAGGGALTIVRDARTHTVKAVGLLPSEAARHDLEAEIARELPGYRLEAQVVTVTGGPASLEAAIGFDAHSKRLESAVASLGQDTEKRFKSAEASVASEAERLRASIDEATRVLREGRTTLSLSLPNYAMFFQEGTSYRSPAEAERDLDAIAALLKSNPGPKIRLIGHGDNIGTRETNLKIALTRAQKVAADLIARGVDETRLVLAARDGSQEITQGEGPGSSNRRVTFEMGYINE